LYDASLMPTPPRNVAAINTLLADDVIFHIPGRHPLAGTYRGKSEVFGYFGRVAASSESADGGFDVHSLTGDDQHVVALVIGTIEHGGIRFVRPTVHVFHVNGQQVTEFWEASIDQHAEDEFWTNAVK
jgi:ketosteroid isomerase-like protein